MMFHSNLEAEEDVWQAGRQEEASMEEGRQRQGSRQAGRHSNESIKEEETLFILILRSLFFLSFSNLKPIIGPRPEFHHTGLLIERKVLDVNHAGRLVDGRRLPLNEAVEPQGGLRRQRHLEIAVGARFGKGFIRMGIRIGSLH